MKSNCSEQSSSKNSLHYQTGNITQHRRKTKYKSNLTLSLLPQPSNCAPNSHRTCSVQCVGTSGFHLSAVLATPYPNSLPLYGILSAELAEVFAVLADFHLLNLLPQTSTISGTCCKRHDKPIANINTQPNVCKSV